MAIRVSSSSQLLSALRSAGSGAQIELTSGTYTLKASGGNYHGAVITEAAGANVTFSKVELRSTSHLTFDRVNFKLPGGEKGVVIAGSSDITIRDSNVSGPTSLGTVGIFVNQTNDLSLQNNNITGFATAIKLSSITGLTVQNNDISNVSWDAMMVGGVHKALFAGNHISLNIPSGRGHTDGMQFYNSGNPLSDVTIRGNTINTHNSSSHGIYLANGGTGTISTSNFFHNLVIEDNTVVSGQVSGIAVGQTSNLSIRANTILQDTHFHSSKEVNIPVIRVHKDSTGVSITGNITHKQPAASGNDWFPTDKPEPTWTIAQNKIVPLGTTVGQVSSALAAASTLAATAPEAAAVTETSVSVSADVFRFDAKGKTDVMRGLDFSDGDRIVLHDYDNGTFHDQAAGNPLKVTAHSASVTIDSLADLRELDRASSAVHVHEGKHDTLVIDIDQPGPDHIVRVLDLAHAYF